MKLTNKNIRAKPNEKFSTRSFGTKFQIRELDNGGHEISGYAIVFNEPSEDMGFIEYVTPTALNGVDLKKLLLLYGHDFNNILARADSGTLTTKIDKQGLFFDAQIPDTTLGNDVYTNVSNGNIKGASFRFDIAEDGDEWDTNEDGQLIHTVTQISDLPEISLTPYPAYEETSVQIERSKEDFLKNKENEMPKDVKDGLDNKQQTRDGEDTTTASDVQTVTLDPAAAQAIATAIVDALKANNTNDAGDDDPNKDPKDEPDKDGSGTDEPDTTEDSDKPDDKNRSKKPSSTFVRTKKGSGQVIQITKSEQEKKAAGEIRSFGDYVKSYGQTRDNSLQTSVEGEILVPKAVMQAYQQPNDDDKVTNLINKVAVIEPSGSLPIIKKGTARFSTKAELAKNPDLEKMSIEDIDYRLQTYAGTIPISNEMLSDYAQIGNIVASYLTTMRSLTEQDKIGAILQTATAGVANDADGLKTAVNVGLANYSKTWIVSESAYNFIDQLKDKQGRYMFNDSLNSPSGKTLLGYNVVIVPDTVLGAANEAHAFIGDPHAFVLEPYKDESSVKWVDNDIYSQKLAAYIRADFKKADGDAGKFLTLGTAAPSTPSE